MLILNAQYTVRIVPLDIYFQNISVGLEKRIIEQINYFMLENLEWFSICVFDTQSADAWVSASAFNWSVVPINAPYLFP